MGTNGNINESIIHPSTLKLNIVQKKTLDLCYGRKSAGLQNQETPGTQCFNAVFSTKLQEHCKSKVERMVRNRAMHRMKVSVTLRNSAYGADGSLFCLTNVFLHVEVFVYGESSVKVLTLFCLSFFEHETNNVFAWKNILYMQFCKNVTLLHDMFYYEC